MAVLNLQMLKTLIITTEMLSPIIIVFAQWGEIDIVLDLLIYSNYH